MVGKAPAFQFYVKDWLSDVELKMASYTSKGIWIDILCYMWTSKTRGEISGTAEKIRQMVGCNRDEIIQFIDDVREFKFCYEVTDDNGKVTLRNRRMYSEGKAKQDNKLRQQRFRDKRKGNKKVTPPSPSPSPSPKKKHRYGKFKNVLLTDDEFQKIRSQFTNSSTLIDNLSYYIGSKGDKYKSHYKTILSWERKNNPSGEVAERKFVTAKDVQEKWKREMKASEDLTPLISDIGEKV